MGPIAGDPGKRYGSTVGRVAELADAPDLGSGPERGGGSIPPSLILFLSRSFFPALSVARDAYDPFAEANSSRAAHTGSMTSAFVSSPGAMRRVPPASRVPRC